MRETILAAINKDGRGLEIGPLNNPLLSKADVRVEYVDRAPLEVLRQWYPDIEPASITPPDHVWGEQTLLECVGERSCDYVVASHVAEHVPDLLGWLREVSEVLVDGGALALIVPDKRCTFDAARNNSTEAEVIDAFVRRLRRPDPRQVLDCYINYRDPTGHLYNPVAHEADHTLGLIEACRRIPGGEYIDAHCWVFTPQSFLRLLEIASRLDLLPFEIAALEDRRPDRIDFFALLRRLPDGLSPAERRERFQASTGAIALPAEQDVGAVLAELAALRIQADQAKAIASSNIWRATAPLRRVVDVVRRVAR